MNSKNQIFQNKSFKLVHLRLMMLICFLVISFNGHTSNEFPRLQHQEVITSQAANKDGGNNWGGHQSRVVHTVDSVFMVYTIDGRYKYNRTWILKVRDHRTKNWIELARGESGREPAHLLIGPGDVIYVIAQPKNWGPVVWSGRYENESIELKSKRLLGNFKRNKFTYLSSGINTEGKICILQSQNYKPGLFHVGCKDDDSSQWVYDTLKTPERRSYSYLFPTEQGLRIVSTLNVKWSERGYDKPKGSFDFVYNAFDYYNVAFPSDHESIVPLSEIEELPVDEYPDVFCNAQNDSYLDHNNNMHVIYRLKGKSTAGVEQRRHVVFDPSGAVIGDVQLHNELGTYIRIFQDDRNQFYLIGSGGVLYEAGSDGLTIGRRIDLPFDKDIEYAGLYIATDRGGSNPSSILYGVYPTDKGKSMVYFEVKLHE